MKFGEKQSFDSKKYTGFDSFKVVAVNPTREELAILKGYEYKETDENGKKIDEIAYEGKDANGAESAVTNYEGCNTTCKVQTV